MAISSIHIQAGKIGFFSHNDRSRKTVNSIFNDEKNEVNRSAADAIKIYRSELEKRSASYQKRTGQKMQKKTVTQLSGIVNLNSDHTMEDLQPVVDHLERTLGTKVLQVAIHRDEGHVDDGVAKKNYHAHIEMMGLDEEGRSVRRKLTRSYLSNLQTTVAETLHMDRGRNYIAERAPRPKRLDSYEYKAAKKAEERAKKLTAKQLKAEIAAARAKLREMEAGRADYAHLEELGRKWKQEAKKKQLELDQVKEGLNELWSMLDINHIPIDQFINDEIEKEIDEILKRDLSSMDGEELESLTDEYRSLIEDDRDTPINYLRYINMKIANKIEETVHEQLSEQRVKEATKRVHINHDFLPGL